MSGFNIFLVIIGLGIVFISYFISEKIASKDKNHQSISPEADLNRELSENEKKYLEKQIGIILEEISEDIEAKTYDRLGQISNEKIISVSELSDQILEKINQNHTEVVFLYNMLNEKEVQLKQLATKINHFYKSVQSGTSNNSDENEDKGNTTKPNKTINQMNQLGQVTEEKSMEENAVNRVNNEEILEMYTQGMTVIEISRELEIGQGEVKLIIDLFQAKK